MLREMAEQQIKSCIRKFQFELVQKIALCCIKVKKLNHNKADSFVFLFHLVGHTEALPYSTAGRQRNDEKVARREI